MDALHQLEILVILFVQSLGAWLATPMRMVSTLGYEEFFMLAMPAFYWCLDAATGLRLAVMLLLSNGINCVFKLAFHSPRPYWLDTRVKAYTAEASFGIPSGHAQTAASLWGLLAARTRETWVKVLLVVVIFLIGFSRIFLGVHFISDVLAGWLIGGLMLWVFLKFERPVIRWFCALSLKQMLLFSLATALLLIVVQLLPLVALSGWQMPPEWQANAQAGQPNSPIDPLNIDGAFTVAGTWLGMLAGVAWLYHRQGGFDASGTPNQRLLRYVIGAAGVLVLWFGLGQVFPRSADVLSYTLRFARYTLVGLWVSALAPLLFERMGIAHNPKAQIPSMSSTENPL